MSLLETATRTSRANRVAEIERREEGGFAQGDFEGSVTGFWQRLDQTGVGIVNYKGKDYKVKPIGFVSLPQGSEVELTHAKGTYYAKF